MDGKIKFDLVALMSLMLYIHKKMQIRIRYTETMKQVLGMIIIPILYMGILVAVLFSFDLEKLSEELEFALIIGSVILMMAASVFTIFKVIMEGGTASFVEAGLRICLNRSTFLYPHKDFFIPFGNIETAALDNDPGKSNFISLHTRVPSKSLMIFPEGFTDSPEFADFWVGLNKKIQQYNRTIPPESEGIIKSGGFYQNKWVKGLAWVSLAVTAWLSFMKIGDPESVSGWKLLMLYCYVVPICYAVFKPK
jgi:hypothetical protein